MSVASHVLPRFQSPLFRSCCPPLPRPAVAGAVLLALAACALVTGLPGAAGAQALRMGSVPAAGSAQEDLRNLEPYHLVAGDRLRLSHAGLETPREVVIDLDGQIRVEDLGGVRLAGLTLDAAEAALSQALIAAELFVTPRVGLSVLAYAPVTVAGDVALPGRFDYQPGLTVASALALAGGSRTAGLTRHEIASLRTDLRAGLAQSNLQIAARVVELARHQAELAGNGGAQEAAPLTLGADLRARIPAPQSVDLDGMILREDRILADARAHAQAMDGFWAREIATLSEQVALYDQRIGVQQAIVGSAARALADAETLQARGLRTTAQMAGAETRDAEARSRVLELETAKILAISAMAEAERARSAFRSARREAALRAAQRLETELADLALTHARQGVQLRHLEAGGMEVFGLVSWLQAAGPIGVDLLALQLSVQAADGALREGVGADTRLSPGDVLMVSVVSEITDIAGN